MTLPDLLALDTNCFVYLFEQPESPRGRFLVDQVLRPATLGARRLVTPALVVAELLVKPYQQAKPERAAALLHALEVMPGLSILTMTVEVADLAAQLRGEHGLPLPDAVVLATATAARAVLLTNDRTLAAGAPDGTVLVLDDVVHAAS